MNSEGRHEKTVKYHNKSTGIYQMFLIINGKSREIPNNETLNFLGFNYESLESIKEHELSELEASGFHIAFKLLINSV